MAIRRLSQASIRTGAKSNKFWDQTTELSGFHTIASQTLTSDTAIVSFTGIPSTYKILNIRVIGRTTSTSNNNWYVKFNNSPSGHRRYFIYNVGTAAASSGYESTFTSESNTSAGTISNDSRAASYFGYWDATIIDYADTNKNKTLLARNGRADGTNGLVGQIALGFSSTDAINQIDFTCPDGSSFKQYSRFSLYGIK